MTIVILHGWSLSSARFSPLTEYLKRKGYRVFCPDLPGFGTAEKPDRPYTLTDYADFVFGYLKTNRIENPVLICHSFGGRVCLKMMSMNQKNVRAIILTGTPGFSPVRKAKFVIFVALAKIGNAIMSVPGIAGWKDEIRKRYYYFVGARDFYRADGAMRGTFKNVVAESLESYMKLLRVPVLLVWGEKDAIVPLSVAKRMQRTIAGSELAVIPEATHAVPFNEPERFFGAVEPFLKRI